ncbi:MAG TPA: serine/threonine-protein kinase [Abditibacteriaceae bacterium]|jgi:serine/threonine-protein kinase
MAQHSSYPNALPPATTLQNGNYRLDAVLGQGGFGITYRGEDVGLRRPVAIKEFFPAGSSRSGQSVQPNSMSATDYEGARETFLEEARTLARFQHPNIVDVYAVFVENNSAYMVMELLRGEDLQKIVERDGAFAPDEAVRLVEPVAAALETVHNAGLLHQDIKPDNIVLEPDGRSVLIDFGLSQQEGPSGYSTMRFSGNTRAGTPGFAPLEQYGRQARVGKYTDVYALAATLYYLLTGEIPVEATDRAAGTALTDIRALNGEVSPSLGQAIMAGLELDVTARPQTVPEFLSTLATDEPAQMIPAPMPQPTSQRQTAPPEEEYEQPQVGQWERVGEYDEPQREPQMPRLEDLLFGGPTGGPLNQPPHDPWQQPQQQRQMPRIRVVGAPGCGAPGCGGCGCVSLVIFLFMLLNIFGSLFTGGGSTVYVWP